MTSPSPVSLRTWLQSAQIPKFADKGTLQDIIGQKRKSSIYPLKVGQLDAELLDEELLQLLKGQLWDALKFFRASTVGRYETELAILLRILLFKFSIWDRGTTYGAMLQNLRFQSERDNGLLDRKPSIRQKLLYGLATIGIRYVWTKVGYYVTENSWGERTSGTKKKLWILLQYVDTAHETFSLVNFLLFLYNGHYRTIIDRLLGLRLVPLTGNSNRQVSFEFLNRQLVWHTLTEFLLFILPLLKLPRLKRQLEKRFIPTANEKGLLAFLPQRTCAICFQEQSAGGISTTIVNAYQADDCGHLYCYGCIVARLKLAEGDGWPCLRCGITIKEAHRWIEIVETPPSDQESDSEKSTG